MDSNHSQDPQSGSPPTSHVGTKTPSPQVVYVQQPGGHAIFRWFSWLGWVGFLFACTVIIGMVSKYEDYFNTTGGIQEEFVSGSRTSDEKVAVIAVDPSSRRSRGALLGDRTRIATDPEDDGIFVRST